MTPAQTAAARRTAVIVFIVCFGLVLAGLLGVFARLGDEPLPVTRAVGMALGFGLVGASGALIARSWRAALALQSIVGTDIPSRKRISAVVMRGQQIELSSAERNRAVRYARAYLPYRPLQVAQVLLLLAGVAAGQLVMLGVSEGLELVQLALVAVTTAAIVAIAVYSRRERRNLRRFVDATAGFEPANDGL